MTTFFLFLYCTFCLMADTSQTAPPGTTTTPAAQAAPAAKNVDEAKVDDKKEEEQKKEEDAQPTRQRVEELLNGAKNAKDLDEAAKKSLVKCYEAALVWIATSEEAAKKTAQLQTKIADLTKPNTDTKTQQATSKPEPVTFPPETTLKEMEQKLSQAEQQLDEAKAKLAKQEEAIRRRDERKAELGKLITDTQAKLEAAKKQTVTPAGEGQSPDLLAAHRLEHRAQLAALENQLQQYRAEQETPIELFNHQRDLAQIEKNACETQVAAIKTKVDIQRKTESERRAEEARKNQRKLADSHPILRKLAERNTELAEEHEKLADSLTEVTNNANTTNKTLQTLKDDFEVIQQKVYYARNSSIIGLVLRKKRNELPHIDQCEKYIRFVNQEMPEAYLIRIELESERASLGDLNQAVADLGISDGNSKDPDQLKKMAREQLLRKCDLLDRLLEDYNKYLDELYELEVKNRKLIEQTEEVANYIDERVLWVRSTEFLGPGGVHEAAKGILDLIQPGPWFELSKQCGLGAIRKPSVILLVLATLVILIAIQKRLRNRIQSLCVTGAGSARLKIWPTLEALMLTATITVPLPLFLAFAGWWIMDADSASNLSRSLGWGLRYTALLLWVARFTRRLCRPGSVAEIHFGWSSYSLAIVRRHLRWLSYATLPLIFVVIFAYHYQNGAWDNSLGRIAFIATMLLLAGFMHMVFFSKNNVLREILARKPDFWLTRFWFLFYVFAIGLPFSLAVLAWIGYYYSAQQLGLRLTGTLGLVLGLVLLHAIIARWFLVKRRNLSIDQAKARQALEAELAAEMEEGTGAPPVIPVAKTEQRNLSEIHQHLNYLLAHAVAVCFLVGCWMIWADVLPALNVLDKHELWSTTVEVVEHQKDADGNLVAKKVPIEVATTARHLMLAALILFATFVIGRRLPALLEITLLSRIHFDRGGRHAISVLLRYLVALIGVIWACNTLSITWSSIQWLAAGMTVGLGFGLQEIFANFISGLILLFERPIRVGDVITIGDTTGTVTDIRIRTTTVTNWDRKELIIPNKDLITGQLLNWTLSDPVNRIVVTVGVAYGSDTRKTHNLLLKIAEEHPNVMENPSPKVTFESFGDSALIFVLRCYIATLDARLDTIHELNETINDRFNQASIEIAFPQMDLHIRSIEQMLPKS